MHETHEMHEMHEMHETHETHEMHETHEKIKQQHKWEQYKINTDITHLDRIFAIHRSYLFADLRDYQLPQTYDNPRYIYKASGIEMIRI